jgi:hypothetical protein
MSGDHGDAGLEHHAFDHTERDANEAVRNRLSESFKELPPAIKMETSPNFRESARLMAAWEKLDPAARRYTLDRVGRAMCVEYGAGPVDLVDKKLPENLHGQYDPKTGQIEINEALLSRADPRQALETYLHEFRHAVQDAEVTAYKGPQWHSVDAARVHELSKPYENPPDGSETPAQVEAKYERYRAQFSEVDPREFSRQATDKILKMREEHLEFHHAMQTARSDGDRAVSSRLAPPQYPAKG